jgi:hypothetical protein
MPAMFNWFNTPEHDKVDPIGDRSKGFYDNFLDKIFGVTERNAQARKDRDISLAEYKLPDLDASSLVPKTTMDKDYQAPHRMSSLADTFNAMQSAMSDSGQMQAATSTSQVFNTPITVEGANINVTLYGTANEGDKKEIVALIDKGMKDTLSQVPDIAKGTLKDALGNARAQQAERQ